MRTIASIQDVYFPTNETELRTYRDSSWEKQNAQVKDFGVYETWLQCGQPREPLDMTMIFTRGGVFRDWEIDINKGYAATYISVPVKL